jgi:sulfite reductase alpha subunit-like flavoprotein
MASFPSEASPLFILYGSATGNAEQIAKDLAATYETMIQNPDAKTHFPSVVCCELDQFKRKCASTWEKPPPDQTTQKKHGLLIVASTTGNGDAPENANRFVRLISRKGTPDTTFQHVAFAVLGLGDTNYDQFCNTGRILDKKITALGGTRVKQLACADEATGLEQVVDPWTESILQDISRACFGTDGFTNESTMIPAGPISGGEPAAASAQPETPTATATYENDQKGQEQPRQIRAAKSDAPLFILYGSATGNAEQIAKDLAAAYETLLVNPDANTFFPSVVCCELDHFKKKCSKTWEQPPLTDGTHGKHGVLIITSTTGNGEAPENADRFFRYINRKNTVVEQPFRHCVFAVLGLGDTNYDQFCNVGKTVDKKLAALGGTRARPISCADEATGLEEIVDPWTSTILTDITNAARGGGGDGSTLAAVSEVKHNTLKLISTSLVPNVSVDEEKKIEIEAEQACGSDSQKPLSLGVRVVRSLLGLDPTMPMVKVHLIDLPSLASSRSSCELFTEDVEEDLQHATAMRRRRGESFDDRATVSTASSSAVHYTVNRPFESTVLGARYLTNTSTEAASKICEMLGPDGNIQTDSAILASREIVDTQFPLTGDFKATSFERNGKRVIELTLSLPDDYTLEYKPGDSLGLVVTNTPESIRFVLGMLRDRHGIDASQKVSIDSHQPITVEEAVRSHIDLCSPLKNKRLLYSLSHHATDPDEIAALQFLSSKKSDGERVFQDFVVKQRLSVHDILLLFPSCQAIALDGLLSILPGIPPRYYSVSSSPIDPRRDAQSLTVAYSVVDYLTPSLVLQGTQEETGRRRVYGTATRYLEALSSPFLCGAKLSSPAPAVKIFPKAASEFSLPTALSTPLVLIGPGTGIAPFLGFLAHRRAQTLSSETTTQVASTVVEGTWRGDFELEATDVPVGTKDANGLALGVDYRMKQDIGTVDVFYGTHLCLCLVVVDPFFVLWEKTLDPRLLPLANSLITLYRLSLFGS